MRLELKMALITSAALTGLLNAAPVAAQSAAARTCQVAALQAMSPANLVIDKAEAVKGGDQAPAHCAVIGHINRGGEIGIRLLLPNDWNKKFLFVGVGSFAGLFMPIDSAPFNQGVLRGYATGTTDTGHKSALAGEMSGEDASWALNNPQAVINHYDASIELSAQAMKQLISAYYSAAPRYAYFQGCSGGGRQAMAEAERAPGTFDGIIAEAAAWNYSRLFSTMLLNGQQILRSDGNWVSKGKLQTIDKAVMAQCDELDGVKDGIITDPRACQPALSKLKCKPGVDTDACLTPQQLATIEQIRHPAFAKDRPGFFGFHLTGADAEPWAWGDTIFGARKPQRDASGRLSFGVFPTPGQAFGDVPLGYVLGDQYYRYILKNDAAADPRDFSLERDFPASQQKIAPMSDATDTDLSRFFRHGGKLLIWHGWSDPAIPPEMSIDLYNRIEHDTRQPLPIPVDQSVRLFMAPGVGHCLGGAGLTEFDMLSAMEAWVERGSAPERIPAAQLVNGLPARTRPLCRYPKAAKYTGKGDSNDERNFVCV